MPAMPVCESATFSVKKNLAGDPFVGGDTLNCPFCGAHVEITEVLADGTSHLPKHQYPTLAAKRAMSRARRQL